MAKDLAYPIIFRHHWKVFREVVKGWQSVSMEKTEPEPEDRGRWEMAAMAEREPLEEEGSKEDEAPGERPSSWVKDPLLTGA